MDIIDKEIDLCAIRAQYWIAMATTGVGLKRELFHGLNGPAFTDEEKIQDCLDTAHRHIQMMANMIEAKKDLIHKSEEMGIS